ncbi:Short stature homeobox protein 2 [Coemansia sp. RSA 2336]|nr:Short stature homeobox protein 2 [Coemansia sp. RSA 2336]
MYTSVHDQPPPPLLPHSVKTSLADSGTTSSFSASQSRPSSSLDSSAIYPLSHPHLLQKPNRFVSRTPPEALLRRSAVNASMQKSPYSRETTDISDQELRQILESENISGLPAPYCLVPHYDGQTPLPQNALWPVPPAPQQRSQSAVQSTTTSQASSGRQGSGNAASASQRASSGSAETTRRRTRTTLTPYQLRVLFRVWERTQYPSSDLRFRLATNLMMTPRNVQIWFQNQRQKTKERAEMRRRTHSPSAQTHVQRQPPRPAHPPHLVLPASGGYAAPGISPPESPFRYSHGPPPPPPAIPTPPAHYMASMPARHTPNYEQSASQNASPVSASFTTSPPATYGSFFQRPSHAQAASQQSQPLHVNMLPPPSRQRGYQHLHHQRHASHPHFMRYEDQGAARSAFTPSDRSLSERGSENAQGSRVLPPPPPPSATLAAEHAARAQMTPSPLACSSLRQSPSLAPCMSSLSMDSPRSALRNAPASVQEQHGRGVQLAEILNPMSAAQAGDSGSGSDSPDKTAAVSDSKAKPSESSQSGPLPSLGTVLANVQSGPGSGEASKEVCTSSPVQVSLSPSEAPSAANDKWRPW